MARMLNNVIWRSIQILVGVFSHYLEVYTNFSWSI
jgi:hypothetical protein